jgi:hypothetical protein
MHFDSEQLTCLWTTEPRVADVADILCVIHRRDVSHAAEEILIKTAVICEIAIRHLLSVVVSRQVNPGVRVHCRPFDDMYTDSRTVRQ